MNLAREIASLKEKGFSEERAQVILVMREAAVALFRAFPDSFLLYGGANLIFFHNSTRHSADLDLLSMTVEMPHIDELRATLQGGLKSLSELLGMAPLEIETLRSDNELKKLRIGSSDGRTLFTVDLTRMGSVLKREIEEHQIESASSDLIGMVKAVSRDLLLLQKAEAFLLRQIMKVRDAYDIKLLVSVGARLGDNLTKHLDDDLRWEEINAEQILERIEQVDEKRCDAELGNVLPEAELTELRSKKFQPLRDALMELFANWI